jgi:uncharacterized protein YneF (UPF0154 family)
MENEEVCIDLGFVFGLATPALIGAFISQNVVLKSTAFVTVALLFGLSFIVGPFFGGWIGEKIALKFQRRSYD